MPFESEVKKEPIRVRIDAFFPELKGGRATIQTVGEGATIKSAMNDAVRSLMKHTKLKRRHFTTFKATFNIFKPTKVKETVSEDQTQSDIG